MLTALKQWLHYQHYRWVWMWVPRSTREAVRNASPQARRRMDEELERYRRERAITPRPSGRP